MRNSRAIQMAVHGRTRPKAGCCLTWLVTRNIRSMLRIVRVSVSEDFFSISLGGRWLLRGKVLGQPVLPAQVFRHRAMSRPPSSKPTPTAVVAAQAFKSRATGYPTRPRRTLVRPQTNSDVVIPQLPRLGSTLAPVLASNDKLDTSTVPRPF